MSILPALGGINSALASIGVPNPASLSEKSLTTVFPSTGDIRANVPLFMKFFCFEYNKSAVGRASAYSRAGGGGSIIPGTSSIKAQIFIPAPPLFTSTTQHSYKAEPTNIPTLGIESLIRSGIQAAFPNFSAGMDDAIRTAIKLTMRARGILSANLGYAQDIPLDKTDMIYKPGGQVRSYEMQIYLPCLSVADSRVAGKIIRLFEALSLPTMLSALNTNWSIMFHPPLWVFGIGPPDTLQIDPDWSGQPQLCVLRTVKSKRVALETNTLAALGTNSGEYKPIAYTLTLLFQELEPAVRITNATGDTSSLIGSRSIGVVTTGDRFPATAINVGLL